MIAVLAGGILSGQNGFIVHFDELQAGRNGTGNSVREVSDGYLVFAGQKAQDLPSRSHEFVRKIDLEGNFQYEFEHRIGENKDFDIGYIDPVATNPDGTFATAMAEGFFSTSETWFYTFGQDGDTISRKFVMTFPVEDSITHAFRQTRPTSDGGYILGGFFDSPSELAQGYLVRLNSDIDTVWTRKFGPLDEIHEIYSVNEYSDGGFIIAGYNLPVGSTPTFLIRTDSNGNEIWRKEFGMDGDSNISSRLTAEGDIITWSTYRENDWPAWWWQMMLTKWNANGDTLWQRKSHMGYVTSTWDIENLVDGKLIASGMFSGYGILAKFDEQGDSLWTRQYNLLHGEHYLYDVEPTSDGGFIATGVAWRYPPLDPDFSSTQVIWVIKTDSMGCVVPGCHTVGVQEYVMDLNEHLKVWPVPTDGILNVELPLPPEFDLDGPVQAILLDPLGREVGSWPVPRQDDVLRLQQHLPELSSGTYYLHLKDQRSWLAGAKLVVE